MRKFVRMERVLFLAAVGFLVILGSWLNRSPPGEIRSPPRPR